MAAVGSAFIDVLAQGSHKSNRDDSRSNIALNLRLAARIRTHHKRQVKLLAKGKNIINVVTYLLDRRDNQVVTPDFIDKCNRPRRFQQPSAP